MVHKAQYNIQSPVLYKVGMASYIRFTLNLSSPFL